ncbi:MAG TPA: hypothetical protein VK564_00550 [Thermodesulfobacteriota bacterium]|nr:hypothetical protein [Thermodesulfobacteriota bacterium]
MKGKKGRGSKVKNKDSLRLSPFPVPLSQIKPKRRRPCPDCRFCQGCSQDRCRLCRSGRKKAPKKLSVAEQIALYERLNKKGGRKKQ